MENIKIVFVDIDNTLLDFDGYVRSCMKDGFRHFGIGVYEPWMYDVFTAENNKLWNMIEEERLDFAGLEKVRWNIVFEKLGFHFDGLVFEKYFRAYLNESAIPVEGSFDLLDSLKSKYVVCAASNGPYDQQRHRLEIGGMLKYFDHVYISEKIGFSKPSAEFFDFCLNDINSKRTEPVSANECVVIGDSITADIKGALNYGMNAIFYDRDPAKNRSAALNGKNVITVTSLKDINL